MTPKRENGPLTHDEIEALPNGAVLWSDAARMNLKMVRDDDYFPAPHFECWGAGGRYEGYLRPNNVLPRCESVVRVA